MNERSRWSAAVATLLEPSLAIVAAMLLTISLTVLAIPEFRDPELAVEVEGGHAWLTASLALQTIVFLTLGLFLAVWRVRPEPERPRARLPAAIGIGLVGGVAAVVCSTLVAVAQEQLGVPVEEQLWVRDVLSRPEALASLAPWMLVLGPVAEEAFFRGYVLRFVGQRLNFAAGLVFSSTMFAAIHMNLSGFMVYLVIGLVLGFAYEITGRLATPIAAHVLNNAVVAAAGVYGANL